MVHAAGMMLRISVKLAVAQTPFFNSVVVLNLALYTSVMVFLLFVALPRYQCLRDEANVLLKWKSYQFVESRFMGYI